jgi:ufm1-conjugating enzyme 1
VCARASRGGIICTTDHFAPLWAKNVPHFGLAHALALGLAPWLAVEVPALIAAGKIAYRDAPTEAP